MEKGSKTLCILGYQGHCSKRVIVGIALPTLLLSVPMLKCAVLLTCYPSLYHYSYLLR